jgi:hypothetical protein
MAYTPIEIGSGTNYSSAANNKSVQRDLFGEEVFTKDLPKKEEKTPLSKTNLLVLHTIINFLTISTAYMTVNSFSPVSFSPVSLQYPRVKYKTEV